MSTVWSICGAGRSVGKTTVATKLLDVLPNSCYAKLGHGSHNPQKIDLFFTTLIGLQNFIAERRKTHDNIIVESNNTTVLNESDLIIFISGIEGKTNFRKDIESLRQKSDIIVDKDTHPKRWSHALRKHSIRKQYVSKINSILSDQRRYLLGSHGVIRSKIWFEKDGQYVFGKGLADILENIEYFGTLREASKTLNMSYRYAWKILNENEKRLGKNLVERQVGGKKGGRSTLTPMGRKILALYRKVDSKIINYANQCFDEIFEKENTAEINTQQNTQSQIPKKQHGFTLLELLIVISVLILLLTVMIPSYSKVKSTARRVVCQSNLKQWSLAFDTYSLTNKGFYPHADGRDRTPTLGLTPSPEEIADYYHGWVDVLPTLMGLKAWREYPKWQHPQKNTFFQCPEARLSPDASYDYYPEKFGYFSYAMNACLELDSNCWAPYDQPGGNNMPSFLKTNQIASPSGVIVLFDQLLDSRMGFNGQATNESAGQHCGSYPKAFSARHVRQRGTLGGNILYADYHVSWAPSVWKDQWPTDDPLFEAPPRDDNNWYPYP